MGIPLPLEAHNTLMDVFTQAGLLGVIAVASLFAGTLVPCFARRGRLGDLIITLAIFSISHFVLRHLTVWFALAQPDPGLAAPPPRHARIGT
jgi:O-antigen ligase